ncbi:MAG: hypothetical protein JW795_19450 [Chitinivibrionales bacterium]|nr:hypothetical protein [Chitinivibrionales bacterium]
MTTAGCTKAMNDGLKFAWYNGHGSNTFWGPPNGQYWGNKDLGSFTNTVYPFMFTAACLTGTFTGSNGCMQEAFSTNVKGPVACIGAYEVSYMGQHSLTRALHREIMEVKKVTKYGVAYYTGLSGYAYDTAKASPKQINYSAGQYHFYGDPGVEMWTPPGATAIENGTLNDQHLSPVRMSVKVLPYRMVLTVNKPLREAATITIYSLRGSALQRVTVAAGDQSYSWDMRSSNGAALAKGTYVATLNSSGIEFKSIIKIGN